MSVTEKIEYTFRCDECRAIFDSDTPGIPVDWMVVEVSRFGDSKRYHFCDHCEGLVVRRLLKKG